MVSEAITLKGKDMDILFIYPPLSVSERYGNKRLSKVGGKGLFVKELETALEEGRADLAVHSLKDVPMELPAGFVLACVMEREDPRDAWVSNTYPSLQALPQGALVGTSSLRRVALLRALRPDLRVEPLRGNLDTRLKKLDSDLYDGIVLAAAGRIDFDNLISSVERRCGRRLRRGRHGSHGCGGQGMGCDGCYPIHPREP